MRGLQLTRFHFHARAVDEQHALTEPGGADIGKVVDDRLDRGVRFRREKLSDNPWSVSSDSASEWCNFTSWFGAGRAAVRLPPVAAAVGRGTGTVLPTRGRFVAKSIISGVLWLEC